MRISSSRKRGVPLLANTVTLRPLRQRSLHLPAANIRVAINRGAFDFLTKPIDFGDLETTIVRTIRHVEAMREVEATPVGSRAGARIAMRYFSPNLALRLAGEVIQSILLGSAGRFLHSSPTSPDSLHWSSHSSQMY